MKDIERANVDDINREEENELAEYIYSELKKADQYLVYCAELFLRIIKKKEARRDEFFERIRTWRNSLKEKGMSSETEILSRVLEIFVSLDKEKILYSLDKDEK